MDRFENLMMIGKEITKEDIERNLILVKEGKSLDLPLSILHTNFKKKYSFKGKEGTIKYSSYNDFWKHKEGEYKYTLKDKAKWCLWWLYFYMKWNSKQL